MSDEELISIGIVVCIVIVIILYVAFFRRPRIFKNIFGVYPEDADQELVNQIINNLVMVIDSEENKSNSYASDEDIMGYLNNKLIKAKDVAMKFGFEVPE